MDKFAARLETLEHQWMRAWMRGDRKAMKAIAARDFVFLLGGNRATMLDRNSWLDAATSRLRCQSYRLGDIYARRHGRIGFFACQMEIEASIDDREWKDTLWVSDLWQYSRWQRDWKLVERVISRPEADNKLCEGIASLQLWR